MYYLNAARAQYPNADIIVSGHSLGGALTHIAAYDFIVNYNIPLKYIITYGAPRAGNDVFAQSYMSVLNGAEVWRVTHWRDIVPHVPTVAMGFVHHPQEFFYTEDNSAYTSCSSTDGEDHTCADQFIIDISISDHLSYLGQDFAHRCNS